MAVCTALLVVAIPGGLNAQWHLDFFSSRQIAENIENIELNMTSVIYVKNSDGRWEETQHLHGNENRIWVNLEDIPDTLVNAFVAIEDERFFNHSGVDWKRTLAATVNQVLHFSSNEFGGSTITQQLIKNITGDNEHDAARKFREIVRAFLIEKRLSKNQIVEAYLNTVSLGNGLCGVQVAANYYFNKDVSELSLVECAALAAITQNPSKYNPVSGEEDNRVRRRNVLDKMLELEKISYDEYDKAYNAEIVLDNSQKTTYEAEINSYFVDALIDQVISDLAETYKLSSDVASNMFYNGGLQIYATVDPDIQAEMEAVYQDVKGYFNQTAENSKGERVHVQSAMTIMDYSGHIVGIVGGAGEKTTNRGLNRATDYPRQPGSTMKPLGVYALAVEQDLVDYTSPVLDEPIKSYYPDGKRGPQEWYGYYKGRVTLNYAIRKSCNTVPVRLLQEIGIENSYDFLTKKLHCAHLVEEDKNLAALALGGCSYGITTTESAAAYAIFGDQGVYHAPTTYYKVTRANGDVLLEYDQKGQRVISPATATIMNHLLQEVVYGSEGTGSSIAGFNYSLKAFAKTGTSSEVNDLWMVAGSPYYVGSVYYGFDEKTRITTGSTSAAKIWKAVMTKVHKGLPKKEFTYSDDVYQKGIGYYKKNVKVSRVVYSNSSSSNSEEDDSSHSSGTTSGSESGSSSGTGSPGDSAGAASGSSDPNTSGSQSQSGTGEEPSSNGEASSGEGDSPSGSESSDSSSGGENNSHEEPGNSSGGSGLADLGGGE